MRHTLTGRPRRPRSPAHEPPATGSASADREPDPESVARAIALRLLTSAPRSRQQLAEAMARRDVPEDVANRVLDRFTEVGLIDDAEYARMLVRSRHESRGLARRALAVELRRKGIDPELATEALGQVDDDAEQASARELVRRRWRPGLDRDVQTRRLLAMLARKGYPSGLSHRVVAEMRDDEGWSDAVEADE
ncbi:regulatory protein RecX [Actinotalea fermentans]|uniref:regulatory protein RecX n=1 Tax=Actinotalea fermentans TaxID=43671 RepID=UPI00389955BE